MPREPTYKQRLFVEAYLGESNGNATDAARRAGYAWPEKVAERLVGKSGIRAAINARVASAAMGTNEVLARMADIASADIGEFLEFDDDRGWRIDLRGAGRRTYVIKRIKRTRDGTEIEIRDSLHALIKLGEYHGLWKRTPTPAIDLEAIRQQLKARREAIRPDSIAPQTESPSGERKGA
jgi:hypothetical protein